VIKAAEPKSLTLHAVLDHRAVCAYIERCQCARSMANSNCVENLSAFCSAVKFIYRKSPLAANNYSECDVLQRYKSMRNRLSSKVLNPPKTSRDLEVFVWILFSLSPHIPLFRPKANGCRLSSSLRSLIVSSASSMRRLHLVTKMLRGCCTTCVCCKSTRRAHLDPAKFASLNSLTGKRSMSSAAKRCFRATFSIRIATLLLAGSYRASRCTLVPARPRSTWEFRRRTFRRCVVSQVCVSFVV
jgi:hypothetical protein